MLLLAVFLSVTAVASETVDDTSQEPEFTISNGTLLSYNGNASKIVIPDGVIKIGKSAFYDNDTVTEIILPDSVTHIGEYAMAECSSLSRVHLSKNLVSIEKQAFAWDYELKGTLLLPEGLQVLGYEVFDASSVTVRIPKSLKSLGSCLYTGKLEVYRNTIACQYALEHLENDGYDVIDAVDIATLPGTLKQNVFVYGQVPRIPRVYISDNGRILSCYYIDAMFDGYMYSSNNDLSRTDKHDCDVYVENTYYPGVGTVRVVARQDLTKGAYRGEKRFNITIIPRKARALSAGPDTTDRQVELKWQKQEEATGYALERYDKAKKKWVPIANTSNTSYVDKNRKASSSYSYRMRVYAVAGGKTYYGDYSPTLKVSTMPASKTIKNNNRKIETKEAAITSGKTNIKSLDQNMVALISQFKDSKGRYCIAYTRGKYLFIKRLNSKMKAVSSCKIKKEYPLVGGVISDQDGYLYVAYGKNDEKGKGHVDTFAFSKYTGTGRHIATTKYFTQKNAGSIDSWDMRYPFDAGNCALALDGSTLICNCAREMYNGHQSNDVFAVNTKTMKKLDDYSNYVSHSFDQDVLISSDGGAVFLNHGDAYDRGFNIDSVVGVSRLSEDAVDCASPDFDRFGSSNVAFHFYGKTGNNWTGATMGNLLEVSSGYLYTAAAPRSMTKKAEKEGADVFVQVLSRYNLHPVLKGSSRKGTSRGKKETDTGILWLTSYKQKYTASAVSATEIGPDRILVMWEKTDNKTGLLEESMYAIISATGKILQKPLSMGRRNLTAGEKPVYIDGYVYWTYPDVEDGKITTYKLKPWKKTKASVNKVSGVAVTEGSNYYSPRYLEVSWNSINQASGYEIWRKTGSKGKYKKITTGDSPVSSSGKKVKLFYRDDSIQEGNTYSYKVRPYRIISGKKKNGAFSKPVSKRIG